MLETNLTKLKKEFEKKFVKKIENEKYFDAINGPTPDDVWSFFEPYLQPQQTFIMTNKQIEQVKEDKPKKEEAYAPSLREGASPSRAQISEIKREFKKKFVGDEEFSLLRPWQFPIIWWWIKKVVTQSEERGEKKIIKEIKSWHKRKGWDCVAAGEGQECCVDEFLSQKSTKQK